MARTQKQISKQLNASFAPERKLAKRQLKSTKRSFKGAKKGLIAQKDQGFKDILTGAKRRGLKFSGIPLEEQAQFLSTDFLPALAQLRAQQQEQRFGLRGSIIDSRKQQGLLAQSIHQQELDRDAAERQAAASRAAAASQSSGLADLLGASLGGGAAESPISSKELRTQAVSQAEQFVQRLQENIQGGVYSQSDLQNIVNGLSSRLSRSEDALEKQNLRTKIKLINDSGILFGGASGGSFSGASGGTGIPNSINAGINFGIGTGL